MGHGNDISWTEREADGVKRTVRVHVTMHSMKWQFKRADEERWNYDGTPASEDWDTLLDILRRRAGRGRALRVLEAAEKMREKAGV